MGIWALWIGDWIGVDASKPAEWRHRWAGAGHHRHGRVGATVTLDAPFAGYTPHSAECPGGWRRTNDGDEQQGGSVVGHRFHEVSTRITALGDYGRCTGEDPRANRSMMIMRPPQQGQGCIRLDGAVAPAGSAVAVSHGNSCTPSSARARVRLVAREP
jgi:hypothetical protein